ncbi:MAG: ABC transporter ATP-binding protein [Bacillota bacterium]|nr:ABC transporter ATP-binding protein [Bacillota bacterium]
MNQIILEAKGICKSFEGSEVLRDISFQVEKGEFVAVMGQSGCGKSTLLYSLSGMDSPTGGEVVFEGQKFTDLSEKEMEKLRLTRMGFIFQRANFLKNLSIEDNIIFPAFQAGEKSRQKIVKEAEELMERMGIMSVADHDIRKVSGGQLQRAAICRAMINHPAILFGDEPTGALNSSATKEVMDILEKIHQTGTTILLVTHDAKVAARAERVIYLEDGRIRDEYRPGSLEDAKEGKREKTLDDWLAKMGF